MIEENIISNFRLRKIDETRNYFLEEIKNNFMVSQKLKKVWKFEKNDTLLVLVSAFTGCISISAFDLFLSAPRGISNSAIGFKNRTITVGIKKCKLKIKKRKKKHNKIGDRILKLS